MASPLQLCNAIMDGMNMFNSISHRRNSTGSNMVEFVYCLVFIFFVILIPLINYGTLLTRWAMANQIIESWTRGLAKKQKMSQAFDRVLESDFVEAVRKPTGVRIKKVEPSLIISKVNDPTQFLAVNVPGQIPKKWLPNGGNYEYTIQIAVDSEIDPLISFQLFGLEIPGLTKAADVRMVNTCLWENMGRDPVTTEYFLNE